MNPWVRDAGTPGKAHPVRTPVRTSRTDYLSSSSNSSSTQTGQQADQLGSARVRAISHEAAHVRGVRSERKAECRGVRIAYAYMQRIGVFKRYGRSQIVALLLDDRPRPRAYKLNDTCSLVGR